jgi:hypothetical protein
MCGWLGESTAAGLGCGLRASGFGLRASGCGLQAAGYGSRSLGWALLWARQAVGWLAGLDLPWAAGCVWAVCCRGLGHGLPRGLRARAELDVGQSGLRSSGWARSRGLMGGFGLDLRGATLCANRMLASLVGVS